MGERAVLLFMPGIYLSNEYNSVSAGWLSRSTSGVNGFRLRACFSDIAALTGYGAAGNGGCRGEHARLLFGSHETSPIIWIGKPAPAMQCKLRVER